jgi:hypothetical protein
MFTELAKGTLKVLSGHCKDIQQDTEAPAVPAFPAAGVEEDGIYIDTTSGVPTTEGMAWALGATEPADYEAMDVGSDEGIPASAEDINIEEGIVTDPPQILGSRRGKETSP